MTVLAVVGGLLFHGAMYGPQAAFLSELFGTKVRYSGVSVGYQLASIVAGGLAPLIAVALYTSVGSGYAVAVYVAVSALITILAVGTNSETRLRDLSDDPAFDRAPVNAPAATGRACGRLPDPAGSAAIGARSASAAGRPRESAEDAAELLPVERRPHRGRVVEVAQRCVCGRQQEQQQRPSR